MLIVRWRNFVLKRAQKRDRGKAARLAFWTKDLEAAIALGKIVAIGSTASV
jgi:hypothetical protein